ncbi:MAG: ParB/RepB/Spo0J family partition protein [Burkholderiales bacterium]|nr:ParB/RepB/Spo0J family partition protein [Burkholderiales bacterium]
MSKLKGLGRGLDALLGADRPAPPPAPAPGGPVAALPLTSLQAGRYQPRTRMDESALQELAASIAQHGVMQPILVRPLEADRYEIIAGERRFRAALLAGLTEVPVLVRTVPDEQALAMALIENIQREDLNPLEEAQAIRRLIEEFAYSHEKAAQAIGRSRSATSNLLRLLNLADPVQILLLAGDLDMGHARALLVLERADQVMLAHEVVERRLSVRETEKRVLQHQRAVDPATAPGPAPRAPDRDVMRLQERLADSLAADVRIQVGARGNGSLVIKFAGTEQFQGLLERLGLASEND